MIRDMEIRYPGIGLEDREDLITAVTEGALSGVDGFEGRSGAKFSTWVWAIYKNKIRDYFRKDRSGSPLEFFPEKYQDPTNKEENDLRQKILECFKKHLPMDETGCIELYLNLYRYLESGRTRKEMAESRNMKPNTLNQRLKRCRSVVRELFGEYL